MQPYLADRTESAVRRAVDATRARSTRDAREEYLLFFASHRALDPIAPSTDRRHPRRSTTRNFPLLRAIERSRAIATLIEHRTPRETTARRADGRDDYKNTIRTWTLVALKAATRPTKEEARRADIVLVCRNGDRNARAVEVGSGRGRPAACPTDRVSDRPPAMTGDRDRDRDGDRRGGLDV